jgi:hypothetical protein
LRFFFGGFSIRERTSSIFYNKEIGEIETKRGRGGGRKRGGRERERERAMTNTMFRLSKKGHEITQHQK